jgi:hypothetical protein
MGATVTSFTGLQNLTNIQQFRADYNSLTSIDLSGLSSLTLVDLSDNDLPGSGTNSPVSVNLSGCTSLESLYLDDNDLSAGFPDLSDCTSLKYIDFDQCGLVGSVDISNLPSLEYIDFSGNLGLTELIISRNQPIGDNANEVTLNDCAFSQTAVDNILLELASGSVSNGYVQIDNNNNGTNASPSQTGIDALNVLVGDKSWSVDYNVTKTDYTVSNQSSATRDCELFPNLGLYSLQSDPLEVVRFYNNADLTSPFLGTADAFFTFVLASAPSNVYTANIDPVTGNVTNVQLCA